MNRIREKYKGQMLLLLTLVIAPAVIYQFAIGDTVRLWMRIRADRENKELLLEQNRRENRADSSAAMPVSFPGSGKSTGQQLPGREEASLSSFLFGIAGENDCVMERYTPYPGKPGKDKPALPVTTAEVVITGKFIPLVKIIYALEEFSGAWKIISTDLKISRPGRADIQAQIQLFLVIQYIQA